MSYRREDEEMLCFGCEYDEFVLTRVVSIPLQTGVEIRTARRLRVRPAIGVRVEAYAFPCGADGKDFFCSAQILPAMPYASLSFTWGLARQSYSTTLDLASVLHPLYVCDFHKRRS